MQSTQVIIPDELIAELRRLKRADHDVATALSEAVGELLELVRDQPGQLCEYGYRVTLTGIARVTDRTKPDAVRALAEFQDVESCVPHENVTITQLSIDTSKEIVLVDIDGHPVGTQ